MRKGPLSPFTSGLCALLLAVLLLFAIVTLVSHEPWYNLFGWSVHSIARLRQGVDSWRPMQQALDYLRAGGNGLYEEIFFARHVKFQYPPSSLLLVEYLPSATLPWLSLALLLVNVLALCLIVERSLRVNGHPAAVAGPVDRAARSLLVFALGLFFYPLNSAFAAGQIQCWLNALFAVAVWLWLGRRPTAAGSLLGLLTWVKPNYGLFLVWGVLRREFRLATAGSLAAIAGVVAGVARAGLHEEIEYTRVLGTLSRHGEAFFANQSVNGLLQRLTENADALKFQAGSLPAYHPGIFAVTMIVMVALIAASLYLPVRWAVRRPPLSVRRGRPMGTAADLALFTTVMTITAPIAWEHHYGMLAPVMAASVVPLVQARPAGSATVPLLMLSWLLMTAHIQLLLNVTAPGWNLVASYRFFGGVLLMAVLALGCRRAGSGAPPTCPSSPCRAMV